MRNLSVYKDKTHPKEYESEFDFSEYLTNKKTGRNLSSNTIAINDIQQNFNKSCNFIFFKFLLNKTNWWLKLAKDFLKSKNNFNYDNMKKIEEKECDDYEIGKTESSNKNKDNPSKEKDKELKDLIFQESTASKDLIKNVKGDNFSKNLVKTNHNKADKLNPTETTAKNDLNKNEGINTEVDNEMQASGMNSNIKIEIEHLDEEIKELQNKLKTMISKKD